MASSKDDRPATAADGDDVKNSAYVRSALEATVSQLKARVRELTEDVETLRGTRTKISAETQDFVAYATAELKAKDDIISELRARIHDIELARDAEIRRLQQQMEAAVEVTTTEQRTMERDLRERLALAESKLEKSAQFFERREELETRIEVLAATLETERAAGKAALQELERKYLLEKAALLKAHAAEFTEMRRVARVEAQRSVDADTQRVLMENRQMASELALQAEESKQLSAERSALMEQSRVLAREAELHAEQEREWARQGALKSTENRALAARVKELESALALERADKEMTRQSLVRAHARASEELRLELDGLRSLVKLKNRELGTIKRLAAIILRQRSEVETFFLEALSEAKADVAARKKAAAAAAAAAARPAIDRAGITVALSPAPAGSSSTAHLLSLSSAMSPTPRAAGLVLGSAGAGVLANSSGGFGASTSKLRGSTSAASLGLAPGKPQPTSGSLSLTLPEGAASLPPGTTLAGLVQHAQGQGQGHHRGLGLPPTTPGRPSLARPGPDVAIPTPSPAPGGGGGLAVEGFGAHGTGAGSRAGAGHALSGFHDALGVITDGPLASPSPAAAAATAAQRRADAALIDVAELTPDDRLKVLRLLFAKIHHVTSIRKQQAQAAQAQAQQSLPPPTASARDRSPPPPPPRGRERSSGPPPPPSHQQQQASGHSHSPSPPPPQSVTLSAPFGLSTELPASLREMSLEMRGSGSGTGTGAGAGAGAGASGRRPPGPPPPATATSAAASAAAATIARAQQLAAAEADAATGLATGRASGSSSGSSSGSGADSHPGTGLHPHPHPHSHPHSHSHGHSHGPALDPADEARLQAFLQADSAEISNLAGYGSAVSGASASASASGFGYGGAGRGWDGDGDMGSAMGMGDGEGEGDDTEALAESLMVAVTEREAVSRRLAAAQGQGQARM